VSELSEIYEINTGVIPAAIFADKVRRTILAILKKIAPSEVIIRDVADFNKSLYGKIVEELKIEKTDPIRLTVKVQYDKTNNKLIFSDLKIIRYVSEEQIKKKYEDEIRRLSEQLLKLDNAIEEQRKNYEIEINTIRERLENYRKELEELRKYKENYEKLRSLLLKIKEEVSSLIQSVS